MKIKGKSKVLAEGEFYPIKSLIDEEILQIIKNYRKQVASRYQAVTSSNMEMVLTHSPFKVSPKIDGELWFMVIEPDASPVLCSSNGRVISGALPVLDEVLNLKILNFSSLNLYFLTGDPPRARTENLLIKSQLLYH